MNSYPGRIYIMIMVFDFTMLSDIMALVFLSSRPFDANKSNANTGMWNWVGNPQSILVNGKGFYQDCPGSAASVRPYLVL